MKSSPLRAWLRQERAREHAELCHAAHRLSQVVYALPDMIHAEVYHRSIREPTADRHIHGRDCEWQGRFVCFANLGTSHV
jgi:hypothetical protein